MRKYKFDKTKHVHTLDGKPLHGVTSVLKYWGDPTPLLNWGVKTAVDYIQAHAQDTDLGYERANENVLYIHQDFIEEARTAHLKKRDKAGDKGTEVHAELEEMMNAWIAGSTEVANYSPLVTKVFEWLGNENITPLASEMNVWSEKHWYGGIADGVIQKDGKKYILDFKTSGTVQTKYFYQMGAYSLAVKEMKEHAQVDGVVIVHIPRGASFNPEKNVYWYYDIGKLERAWISILETYKTDKEVSKLVTY